MSGLTNLEAAFMMIRKEAEERVAGTNNDLVAVYHTCLLEVGILVDKEMCGLRKMERETKCNAIT